jgi:signal transduction histidine kinase
MSEEAQMKRVRCGADELDERAPELARAWVESEGSLAGEAEDPGAVARAESLIRWIAAIVEPGSRTSAAVAARLDELSQMIVHELKNPLAQVQVGVDMLGRRAAELDEDERTYLGWIERGAARALEVLEDVRVLGLAEAPLQVERWLPARAVVAGVLARVREEADRAGVECAVEGEVPDCIVDSAQVGLALGNLLSNAVKYADPRKPERWVRLRVERVTGVLEGWRFTVADNGLGIPERLQREVFRSHFRGHPEVAEGTGLGLAITRQVIERRNGQIWFHSMEGAGSTFYFAIPDRAQPGDTPLDEPPDAGPDAPKRTARLDPAPAQSSSSRRSHRR